ncbi:hypothetical protein MMC26_003826 [Xylographa opegraphella]|nr:hypothetical protein [Xylographa opegraphella]
MGVTRKVVKPGNGVDRPKPGDEVTIEYTGNLYDESKGASNDYRGKQFDSSVGRGDFKTAIGVGKVIKGSDLLTGSRDIEAGLTCATPGWDEGVTDMTLGEKSVLTISGDYAYGDR